MLIFTYFRLWAPVSCLIESHRGLRWRHLKILRIDLFVKIHHIMHFGLRVEPPLCWGRSTDKEHHRGLKQRETDHKQHKATSRFCGALNYNRGRSRHKQSCSFLHVVWDDICSYMVFLPFLNILESSMACSSLLSALKLHWYPWSLERGQGLQADHPPPHLFSINKALM